MNIDLRDLLAQPSRFFIDGKPVTGVSLWVACDDYEVRCSGEDSGNLSRLSPAHCLCPACRDGTIHASDCAVHNEPALPAGPCTCGVTVLHHQAKT